jgi:hypothetical protein
MYVCMYVCMYVRYVYNTHNAQLTSIKFSTYFEERDIKKTVIQCGQLSELCQPLTECSD